MLKKVNLHLLLAVISLLIFGVIMIYSSSYIWAEYKFNDSLYYVKHQLLFVALGIIILFIIKKIDYKIYYEKADKILFICLLLLILVLIPNIGMIRNGSRSWFGFGGFGIQPSEFMKIGIIIFTAKYLSDKTKELKMFFKGLLPILLVLFLTFGLIMLEPDFGSGMIIVVTIIAMLFVSGVNMKFFYSLGFFGLIGIVILILLAPYRIDRIVSFLNPWKDPLGTGFQIIQSLYAIGPGGLLGMGFLSSRQKHFYLPEPQTDFIFAIISEELGVLGVIIVVSLFAFILYKGFKIALNAPNHFSKYLAFGLTFQLMFQTIMNLMVVIGLIPVTGYTQIRGKVLQTKKAFILKEKAYF